MLNRPGQQYSKMSHFKISLIGKLKTVPRVPALGNCKCLAHSTGKSKHSPADSAPWDHWAPVAEDQVIKQSPDSSDYECDHLVQNRSITILNCLCILRHVKFFLLMKGKLSSQLQLSLGIQGGLVPGPPPKFAKI